MPELPDLRVYVDALRRYAVGATLTGVRLASPFLLRTWDPPLSALHGRELLTVSLIGKRMVFGFDGELFAVLHLMIAGRIRWKKPGATVPKGRGLAGFDFVGGPNGDGTLLLTEASKKKRASLHVVSGPDALAPFDRGGLDVFSLDAIGFRDRLRRENRTLKRALTDPRIFAGIGNAYSDEILHRARLSPVQRTRNLDDVAADRLFQAALAVLTEWTDRLTTEVGDGFPDKVTAFRKEMAVHGRFREPCPDCGGTVQRIRFADNEMNYCPRCQTDGRLLADRGLSRLLKGDWPKTIDEMESRLAGDD